MNYYQTIIIDRVISINPPLNTAHKPVKYTLQDILDSSTFITDRGERYRRNGKNKLFKKPCNQHLWKIPVKRGLYEYTYIDENNVKYLQECY